VDLPEEEPVVVALALLYIYCGRLKSTLLYANETDLQSAVTEVWPLLAIAEDTNGSMESSRQTIEKLAKLCKLADRLMMDDLLEVAAATLIAAGDPVNSLWYACYVDGHGASEVSRRLLCVLETVYEIVPDNHYLRTHLVQMGFDFCYWQLDCGDVQQSIEDLIKSKDRFGWDLVEVCRLSQPSSTGGQYERFAARNVACEDCHMAQDSDNWQSNYGNCGLDCKTRGPLVERGKRIFPHGDWDTLRW
jgi:hypothetical protein